MSFLTIKNLKKKEKDIQAYLANRNKIKTDFTNKKIFDYELKYETDKLFEPVTNTLNKTNEIVLLNQKKIGDFQTINNTQKQQKELPAILPQLPQNKILALPEPLIPQPIKLPEPLVPQVVNNVPNTIKVGKLISTYLSNTHDRSAAGYSIKYRQKENKFSIGNAYINFNDNSLTIRGKTYTGTTGLMELLTKSNPDMNKVIEEDLANYKQILDDTNAIYTNFDKKNRPLPFNNSLKYKIIRDKLFPEILKSASTSNILNISNTSSNSNSGSGMCNTPLVLPSDPNDLVDQLKLSVSSFNAGNNGEYNRINSILDLLHKNKIISIDRYKKIYNNIFS